MRSSLELEKAEAYQRAVEEKRGLTAMLRKKHYDKLASLESEESKTGLTRPRVEKVNKQIK